MSSKHILEISKSYALYVATNRAIPSVIDGLKHGQRMALWLLRNKSQKIKTMALTGSLLAEKIYVHGDASANNTISLLAAPFKNNVPLITGHGFFGSRVAPSDMGAPRYTDVSKSLAAAAFLYNDLELVPMRENYDGSTLEPMHFVPIIPIVLLNGITGVAVGFSTEILPRKLSDITQATIDIVKGKQPKELIPFYENYGIDVVKIGPNQWENIGKATISNSSTITVTELPPGLTLEKFRKKLIDLEEKGEILDFDDNSAEFINIEIRMKKGILAGSPSKIELVDGKKVKIPEIKAWDNNRVIEFLKLKEKVTERIVVLDWSQTSIRSYANPHDLINDFVKFRLDIYKQRYQRLLKETNYNLVYWKLLKALFEHGFTKKLGTFSDKLAVVTDVSAIAKKSKLLPDDEQVEKVVNLPTYRWTVQFKEEVENKILELSKDIIEYTNILSDPEKIKEIYISELEQLKKLK